MPRKPQTSIVVPFQRNKKVQDLRSHLDGPTILGKLQQHLDDFSEIDEELANSVQTFDREILDQETGEVLRTEVYQTTTMDKETIAVYHARQQGRKMQIDVYLRMLNKIMPDLKALELTDDVANSAERALKAFARAADES